MEEITLGALTSADLTFYVKMEGPHSSVAGQLLEVTHLAPRGGGQNRTAITVGVLSAEVEFELDSFRPISIHRQ